MNKQLIVPIVSLIVLLAKQSFDVEISNEMMDTITEGLLAVVILVGILTNPKKVK